MKRIGNLWPQMISFESLLKAAHKAQKGKRFRPDVAAFNFNIEYELCKLQDELLRKTYTPGAYRSFLIYEPKQRQISAAPYRDRVVHHAMVGILEPLFDKAFIHDSYACRKDKGSHAAVDRCQHFAAKTLGISPRSLWTLTKAGTISHVRLGRRVMYSPQCLQEAVATNTFVGGIKNGERI